jgi:carbonic anhydrase
VDPRCAPEGVLGFHGFDTFTVRTVGGRIGPALIDLASLDSVFDLHQIVLMHHSNCGTTHGTAEQLRSHIKAHAPTLDDKAIDGAVKSSGFKADDDGALKEDLKLLKESQLVRRELSANVVGLWLDVETGLVREVK